jgi:hypothetical protein
MVLRSTKSRRGRSMATKAQVAAAAKRAGFVFEVGSDSVFIAAPEGFCFADQTYGCRYSEWPTGRDEEYSKAYAYSCCAEIIAGGLEKI